MDAALPEWDGLANWRGAEVGDPVGKGTVNDVRYVDRDGERLVGRRTLRSESDLEWEVGLLCALEAAGLAVPELIPTDDGRFHADGLVLMSHVDGAMPESEHDKRNLGGYLRDLHAITAGWEDQRPGWTTMPDLVSSDRSGPVDLSQIPDEVVAMCRRVWAPLAAHPRSVIHGDPNPTNVRIRRNRVVLLDWDEARFDASLLDLAARGPLVPDLSTDDRYLGEQALHAWEACLFWTTAPDYARRRFEQIEQRA